MLAGLEMIKLNAISFASLSANKSLINPTTIQQFSLLVTLNLLQDVPLITPALSYSNGTITPG
jgi:hypothetical protein